MMRPEGDAGCRATEKAEEEKNLGFFFVYSDNSANEDNSFWNHIR